MGYNFDDVINQANAVMSGSYGKPVETRYSVLYPSTGRTIVKLLFCPASNTAMRLIRRHTCSDDKTKVMCNRTFADKSFGDCPVCKVLDDIRNAKGLDLYKYVSKLRFIAYAHYISSTIPNERIQPGNLVLLMGPWTVYRAICETFNNYSGQRDNISKLIATNQGPAFIINRASDNSYTVQLDAMNIYSTCKTDEEFQSTLDGFPPLETCIVKDPPSDEEVNNMNNFANELRQKFLLADQMGGNIQTFNQVMQNAASLYPPPISPVNNASQRPAGNNQPAQFNQAPLASSNQNHPACYGQQSTHDPNECLMCPSQISCIEETRKKSSKLSQGVSEENFPM